MKTRNMNLHSVCGLYQEFVDVIEKSIKNIYYTKHDMLADPKKKIVT